jgi:hypothetical protein
MTTDSNKKTDPETPTTAATPPKDKLPVSVAVGCDQSTVLPKNSGDQDPHQEIRNLIFALLCMASLRFTCVADKGTDLKCHPLIYLMSDSATTTLVLIALVKAKQALQECFNGCKAGRDCPKMDLSPPKP